MSTGMQAVLDVLADTRKELAAARAELERAMRVVEAAKTYRHVDSDAESDVREMELLFDAVDEWEAGRCSEGDGRLWQCMEELRGECGKQPNAPAQPTAPGAELSETKVGCGRGSAGAPG